MKTQQYNKYAFISYNHQDERYAKWLQRKLEAYRLPTGIVNEYKKSSYLQPVFRDKTDLNSGILGDELRKNLETSKYLIVICSKHSAASKWVNEEVDAFIHLGRVSRIIPVLVEDVSDPNTIYPPCLRQHFITNPQDEVLAVTISDGRQQTLIRVVSRLLEISYDELWKRHERERKRNIILISSITPVLCALLYYFIVPISLEIHIRDEQHHLPLPESALLTFNDAEYSLTSLDTTLAIHNIPGYYRGRKLPVGLSAKWYDAINDEVSIGFGTSFRHEIALQRDSTFAVFAGEVRNTEGQPVSGAIVSIGDEQRVTDDNGYFRIDFPVSQQSPTKEIKISKDGYDELLRDDESPDAQLVYILHSSE